MPAAFIFSTTISNNVSCVLLLAVVPFASLIKSQVALFFAFSSVRFVIRRQQKKKWLLTNVSHRLEDFRERKFNLNDLMIENGIDKNRCDNLFPSAQIVLRGLFAVLVQPAFYDLSPSERETPIALLVLTFALVSFLFETLRCSDNRWQQC